MAERRGETSPRARVGRKLRANQRSVKSTSTRRMKEEGGRNLRVQDSDHELLQLPSLSRPLPAKRDRHLDHRSHDASVSNEFGDVGDWADDGEVEDSSEDDLEVVLGVQADSELLGRRMDLWEDLGEAGGGRGRGRGWWWWRRERLKEERLKDVGDGV